MATAAICLARGIERDAVAEALRTFTGVAHRLETIAVRGGVAYVNDSKATNIASTLVALAAYPSRVHLIAGGVGKGQEFALLADAVASSCRAVYLIGEDGERIAAALAVTGKPMRRADDLVRAVEMARDAAAPGDVVLLSPACASFDQYANFEARGEHFRALVEAL
jgi:UDP-N-acetylmuramoylalanine--D-glutamate ligase